MTDEEIEARSKEIALGVVNAISAEIYMYLREGTTATAITEAMKQARDEAVPRFREKEPEEPLPYSVEYYEKQIALCRSIDPGNMSPSVGLRRKMYEEELKRLKTPQDTRINRGAGFSTLPRMENDVLVKDVTQQFREWRGLFHAVKVDLPGLKDMHMQGTPPGVGSVTFIFEGDCVVGLAMDQVQLMVVREVVEFVGEELSKLRGAREEHVSGDDEREEIKQVIRQRDESVEEMLSLREQLRWRDVQEEAPTSDDLPILVCSYYDGWRVTDMQYPVELEAEAFEAVSYWRPFGEEPEEIK